MTLTETEETLQTLIDRHPGLDDSMLVTLLLAGGWEEKEIKVARTLFKQRGGESKEESSIQKNLPIIPSAMELPAEIQSDHLLVSGEPRVEEADAVPVKEEKASEPQSLVQTPANMVSSKRDELPHDLPLRPFETSDHIWPFSRYKDVFYGEVEHEEAPIAAPTPEPVLVQPQVSTPPAPKVSEPPIVPIPPVVPVARPAPAPSVVPEKSEDKLVIIAFAMLVAVLLVLGYMYSNGRL
jgi:hypothetical protein